MTLATLRLYGDVQDPDDCLDLRQPEMRSSFNDLLMALSILNIIYICTGIVDYTFVKVSINVIDFELSSLEECC